MPDTLRVEVRGNGLEFIFESPASLHGGWMTAQIERAIAAIEKQKQKEESSDA